MCQSYSEAININTDKEMPHVTNSNYPQSTKTTCKIKCFGLQSTSSNNSAIHIQDQKSFLCFDIPGLLHVSGHPW